MQTETIVQGLSVKVAARIAEGQKSPEQVASDANVSADLLDSPGRMTIRELIDVCLVLGLTPADLFATETVTR